MSLKDVYERHAGLLYVILLLVPVVTIAVGTQVAPETFWDRYIWEDIWGPTTVDANGWPAACWTADGPQPTSLSDGRPVCPEGQVGAKSGYTATSEATYGIALALILYGVWTFLIRQGRINTDGWFVLALLPFILFGPTIRSLEDARVFLTSDGIGAGIFAWVFISPWIYFQIGAYTIAALSFGVLLRNLKGRTSTRERVMAVGALLTIITSVYSIVVNAYADQFLVHAHPAWAWIGAALGLLLYGYLDQRGARLPASVAAAWGIATLAPAIGLILQWTTDPWSSAEPVFHYDAGAYIIALTVLTTGVVFLVGRFLGTAWKPLMGLALGINVAIVFGHMLDAWATFVTLCSTDGGVCSGGTFLDLGLGTYQEKHPLSEKLLGIWNGWGFPAVKLGMVLVVVYLLDKEFADGTDADRTLIGLIRMAIFILGFAPGLRDLFLVVFSMGTV